MDERERRTTYAQGGRRPNAQKQRTGGSPRPGGRRTQGMRPDGRRPVRRSSRARRRRRNLMIRAILLIALIIIGIGGFLFWRKYGSSKEEADLEQYYGIQSSDDLAIVVDNQVIGALEENSAGGKVFDGVPYVEYSILHNYINERFYWDSNENVLLYTLPGGSVSVGVGSKEYTDVKEKKSEDYTILKTEGQTAYIALAFVQQYTNMEYSVYENPNRAVVVCDWGEKQVSTFKRNTEVRRLGGVKSPILTKVEKSDEVQVLEDEDDWQKVATADGFVGYVKTSSLKKITTKIEDRAFEEPVYSNISKDYTINMVWNSVENDTANGYVLQMIAGTKGVTTIAPTWFSISDTNGNISSIANSDYVNYAHQSGLEVWGVLRDFHGGISSYDESYEVLSYTSKRENLINQVIAAALQTGLDGINLDFELISAECGEHYIQFVRELSVKCRQNGLVFSVDNYVPMPYNQQYDLKEQGIVADYVIIMGYDEHTDGSYEAGSVASYNYVKNGIEDALQFVPKEKLIHAIPFYTRLWLETPKTAEELENDAGTEAANYPNKVTSTALGMDEAEELLSSVGVQAEWDDTTKQNYAEWETEGGTYKIWLEDGQSIEEKLKLIKEHQLAGVAEWRLGWENSSIWDLILKYVN